MLKNSIKFVIWNALVLMRGPVRAVMLIFAWLSLGMIVAGVAMLFFGGIDDLPLYAHILALVASVAFFAFWSSAAYFYDTLVFRLTPEGREIILTE